jgi:hypothetical protein
VTDRPTDDDVIDAETETDEDAPQWTDLDATARRTRARTIRISRWTRRAQELGRYQYPPEEFADVQRPRTRADCLPGGCNAQRPCPFVSCRWHLAIDVNPLTGSIKLNFPESELEDLPDTCALDVTERGGLTLEAVADVLNLTRERVRQVQNLAMDRVSDHPLMRACAELGGVQTHDADDARDVPRSLRHETHATITEEIDLPAVDWMGAR